MKLPKDDYFFKVVVVGKSGVGKTSYLNRISDDEFKETYSATIGVDFKNLTITTDSGKRV